MFLSKSAMSAVRIFEYMSIIPSDYELSLLPGKTKPEKKNCSMPTFQTTHVMEAKGTIT